jgi:hypothetical protein
MFLLIVKRDSFRGNLLSLKNYGSATVTASQPGDSNHNAALSSNCCSELPTKFN